MWTLDQEALVVRWGEMAKHRQLAHAHAQECLDRYNRMMGVPSIVLQAIIATLAFSSIGVSNFSVFMQAVQGTLMVLSASLSAAYQFLDYGKLSEKHKYATDQYQALRVSIEAQMALDAEGRQVAKDFILGVKAKLVSYRTQFPYISSSAEDETDVV